MMEIKLKEVGDLLRKHGYRRTQLGIDSGYSQTHLSRILNGHSYPSKKFQALFAFLFKKNIDMDKNEMNRILEELWR